MSDVKRAGYYSNRCKALGQWDTLNGVWLNNCGDFIQSLSSENERLRGLLAYTLDRSALTPQQVTENKEDLEMVTELTENRK